MVEDNFDSDGVTAPKKRRAIERAFYAQPTWKKSIDRSRGHRGEFRSWMAPCFDVLMVGTPETLVVTGAESGSPAAQVSICVRGCG